MTPSTLQLTTKVAQLLGWRDLRLVGTHLQGTPARDLIPPEAFLFDDIAEVPPYAQEISGARQVIEYMERRGWSYELELIRGGAWRAVFGKVDAGTGRTHRGFAYSDNAPTAICRAACRAEGTVE